MEKIDKIVKDLSNMQEKNGDILDTVAVVVHDCYEMLMAKDGLTFNAQKNDCKLSILALMEQVISTKWYDV